MKLQRIFNNFIDMAGAEFLAHLARERRDQGGGLYFYDIKDAVCEPFRRGECLIEIGTENFFMSKKKAVAEIFQKLDRDICLRCKARIFLECRTLPPPE